ncbi:MAG: hypothetical protein DME96_02090 [Verrucomicrobia bacterium]|nr:MAG: hypothetical protein DME96_02090 [Verrucomicrobiota bacterium]
MPHLKHKNIGVIGLGIIGRGVSGNLRRKGFPVFVWNRTPRPVPNFVGSPAELAGLCNYIQVYVSDDEALLQTVNQLSEKLATRHIVIAHSRSLRIRCGPRRKLSKVAARVLSRRHSRGARPRPEKASWFITSAAMRQHGGKHVPFLKQAAKRSSRSVRLDRRRQSRSQPIWLRPQACKLPRKLWRWSKL